MSRWSISVDRWRSRSLSLSVAALLVFFALALHAALAKTPTADEGMHLLRSQVLRHTGELGLQGQHTPLSHWLIGTFFATEPTVPDVTSLPSWSDLLKESLVQEFLWSGAVDVSRLLFLGRLPVIFVGLLLGALLSRWSHMLGGISGQFITLMLFAFAPNLLASAALATTDLVATAAYFAAVFSVWFYWQKPSTSRWLLAGLALGLAVSSKLTGLLVMPVALILCYSESPREAWWRPGLRWLSWLPLAGLVLWAAYRFEIGPVGNLPFPVPAATFLANFVEVQAHIERGHYAFLLGERSSEGWWAYFGLAYLFKTPIVTLVLLLFAVIYVTWKRLWRRTTALWLPAGALFLAASASRLNIGYRHILPMTPLLWSFIAVSGPMWMPRRATRWALAALLTLYALGTLLQAPHYLAYFNWLVGGSEQGYRYLGDSNIDWGQDLRLLAEYARENEVDPLFVSYFGPSDPAYYGLDAPPLFDDSGMPIGFAPANPAPGRYAISVNHLQSATPAEPDLFDWFRDQEPLDHLGYSILIFDVETQRDGNWLAHCLDPVALLDEDSAERFVGRENLRHVFYDCRQSWVIPTGDEPGWYVLPLDFDPEQINPAFGEELDQIFVNEAGRYKIAYWSGSGTALEGIDIRSQTYTLPDGTPFEPPVDVGGLAQLVGGFVNGSTWGVVWLAEAASAAPLSVMMHLYAGDVAPGELAAEIAAPLVGDGLGFVASQWQPGDIIVQYHDFDREDGRYLESGIYDFTTGERLQVSLEGESDSAIRIRPYAVGDD